jgi:hypothetical protein
MHTLVAAGTDVTVTVGVSKGFTVIVMILLVAVSGLGQGSLLVITTFTWLPFARLVVLYVELLVPTGVAPTYH